MTKYYIVVNPAAGGGNVERLWPKINDYLTNLNVDFQTITTSFPGHATSKVKGLLTEIHNNQTQDIVIIAAGGDGTLHEVVEGCCQFYENHPLLTKIPVTFLPIGSGNDFARAVSMPTNWKKRINQIISSSKPTSIFIGKYRDLDSGKLGHFINNYGIGFDATVVYTANHSLLKKNSILGRFSYIASILHVLRTFKAMPIFVTIDDKQTSIPNGYLVTTTNIPYFGGGVRIAPSASIRDEKLELIIVEKPTFFQLLKFIVLLMAGKHLNLKFVHHYSKKSFTIRCEAIRHGQIDGEELGKRKYNIEFSKTQYPFILN
ncbi:diacylglycerol kinase family protein [Lentilactobacillus sp. Marseille-Q4993]|uniref:diacylglycerol/lipid kinase family protein n=1 Tax=Lentilactobacillus sp. Marseille-Q4993 TaxID=3039492 RepID=UPI0024BC24C3|nr:diacylglycerol kinase family protein [Lentilactobacillus sp. Marseille-Q4993]